MKSVSEVLLQRRSIRRYERESIPEETMQFVYDAIRNTSTSYNGQQFSVIDIDNQETKEALYALTNQKQIKTCNHFLVFCADYNKIWGLAQKKGIEIPPFQNTVDGIMVGIMMRHWQCRMRLLRHWHAVWDVVASAMQGLRLLRK